MKISPEITALAEKFGGYITPRSREPFLLGLAAERVRLGTLPFLVFVEQDICDYEGWCNSVFLSQSFASLPEASHHADALSDKIRQAQLSSNKNRAIWSPVDDGKLNLYAPKFAPETDNRLQLLYDNTFGVQEAAGWDSKYTAVRIIGNFNGPIISAELYLAISERISLNMYFEAVGEAAADGLPDPHPY